MLKESPASGGIIRFYLYKKKPPSERTVSGERSAHNVLHKMHENVMMLLLLLMLLNDRAYALIELDRDSVADH